MLVGCASPQTTLTNHAFSEPPASGEEVQNHSFGADGNTVSSMAGLVETFKSDRSSARVGSRQPSLHCALASVQPYVLGSAACFHRSPVRASVTMPPLMVKLLFWLTFQSGNCPRQV